MFDWVCAHFFFAPVLSAQECSERGQRRRYRQRHKGGEPAGFRGRNRLRQRLRPSSFGAHAGGHVCPMLPECVLRVGCLDNSQPLSRRTPSWGPRWNCVQSPRSSRVNAYGRLDFATGEWRLCEVECRHDSQYNGALITLGLGVDEVTATAYHPFWVAEGEDLENRPNCGTFGQATTAAVALRAGG